ncbi:hypothetical protein EDC18_10333 [Natranaerovirga pectinivora]|uniref:Uncharacterized protein n=1 Tax=Natranaerovirga pectinivora TaxID=682400 RepID=A0A4R3MP19_9FIRM|nr:hypothetical protein [Natranaerovirga pectinivora]TCT15329.1 hypothetical protein EDC18_10333 [Natranaerovirga pectinivora]
MLFLNHKKTIDIPINKKVPLLTLDNRWHELFPSNNKPKKIVELENKLNKLIQEQGKVNTEFKEYTLLKKKFVSEIMNNMSEAFEKKDENASKNMEKSKKYIDEINEKLIKYEMILDELPHKIKETNEELLKVSVNICYNDMEKSKKEIVKLNEWIEETKSKLKENIIIKQEKEEQNQKVYTYLHDLLGFEIINLFDDDYGDEE